MYENPTVSKIGFEFFVEMAMTYILPLLFPAAGFPEPVPLTKTR
jgi:hypothetical protein